MLAQLRLVRDGTGRRYHICDELFVPRAVLPDGRHGALYVGVTGQYGFDLAQLDAEAAQLHLVVGPAEVGAALPSSVHLTTSPVRYIRAPGGPYGLATNRSAVSAGRWR